MRLLHYTESLLTITSMFPNLMLFHGSIQCMREHGNPRLILWVEVDEEGEQSLKLALKQPWV